MGDKKKVSRFIKSEVQGFVRLFQLTARIGKNRKPEEKLSRRTARLKAWGSRRGHDGSEVVMGHLYFEA
jgi:hypothetical protein